MRAILILSPGDAILPGDAMASGASALLLRPGGGGRESRREAVRVFAKACLEAAASRTTGRPSIFVQVAPVRTPQSEADLEAVVAPGLDGVFLEACDGRADLQQLAARLAVWEAKRALPEGRLRIVALAAQTPTGVFALGRYKNASPRLSALAMDDAPLPGSAAPGVARALLALAAAAAGVPALAAAPDVEGCALEEACRAAGREGFAGLMTPRASEIPVIARALA